MAASTEIRKAVPGGLEIDGAEKVTGSYVSVALRSVSYYPVDKVIRRIVQSIYGVDLQDGLYSSEKFHQDEKNKISSINLSSPLSPGTAEGYFILFLPVGKPAWGLMDIQKVRSYRPDINLSLISPLALMPHPLHVVHGGFYDHKSQFSVVDKDGSQWTLHCDVPA